MNKKHLNVALKIASTIIAILFPIGLLQPPITFIIIINGYKKDLSPPPDPLPRDIQLYRREWELIARPILRPTPEPTPNARPQPWQPHETKGSDQEGRQASFTMLILSQNYNWSIMSCTDIEYLERKESPQSIREHFESPGLQERMRSASDIIAVGTASCEGAPDEELDRATKRAKKLSDWLRESMTVDGSLESYPKEWLLVLGKYCGACNPELNASSTATQRRIIVLTVSCKEEGINLEQAIRNGIDASGRLGFQTNEYCSFMLTPS